MAKLLSKMPAGNPTAKDLAPVRSTLDTFARLFQLSHRYNTIGLDVKWTDFVCTVFECKPWNTPTVGDATEEQIARLEAAVAAAEAKGK